LHQAGSLLSSAYSNNNGWDRAKSLDLPGFFLDTAYGSSLERETMDDRRKRPRRNVDVGKDEIDKVLVPNPNPNSYLGSTVCELM
jgi:hypothetical protein